MVCVPHGSQRLSNGQEGACPDHVVLLFLDNQRELAWQSQSILQTLCQGV